MLPVRDRLATRRVPIVNYALIALNVLAFIWERAMIAGGHSPHLLLAEWGLVPVSLVEAPLEHTVNVFSSMFLHDPTGWFHIGGNILFLWIFGDNVEDAMGRGRYLAFYLLVGVAAAGAQVMIDPYSRVPMVGASGAIAGVLAAYGSLYPRSPVTVLNPIPPLWLFFGIFLELPAWVVILEFFVVNAVNGLRWTSSQAGGVAFFAHLGGFIAGLLLVRVFVRRVDRRDHDRWTGFRSPTRRAPRAPDGYEATPERRGPWG